MKELDELIPNSKLNKGEKTHWNNTTLVSRTPHTHNSAVSTPFYTYMWAEPTVKLPCSRRGNRDMYIASVTPYSLQTVNCQFVNFVHLEKGLITYTVLHFAVLLITVTVTCVGVW